MGIGHPDTKAYPSTPRRLFPVPHGTEVRYGRANQAKNETVIMVNKQCVNKFNRRRLYTGLRLDCRLRLWAPMSASRTISTTQGLRFTPISVNRQMRKWLYYNCAAGSFRTTILCSRLYSIDIDFYFFKTKNRFSSHPFGGLKGNVHTSSIAHWKARGQLPIHHN